MRWLVTSGDLEAEVDAEDAFAACVKAVGQETWWSLGLLMQADENGMEDDEHTCYCSTERVMEAAGQSFKVDESVQHLLMKNRQ